MARARAYILGRMPQDKQFKGQANLIIGQMGRAEAQAKTVKEIADAITNSKLPAEMRLQTRQDPIRVVSFYMSVWKKKGWVKEVSVERGEEEAAASAEAEAAPTHAEDDGTDATTEERVEAMTEAEVTATHEEADQRPPDFTGMKVSDAVLTVLQRAGGESHTPEGIAEYLTENGFEVRKNQVSSALSNLVAKGTARKVSDGQYARA